MTDATTLALQAVQKINKSVFKVFATLDIERPETIHNFAKFGEVLMDAYQQGLQDATSTRVAALEDEVSRLQQQLAAHGVEYVEV